MEHPPISRPPVSGQGQFRVEAMTSRTPNITLLLQVSELENCQVGVPRSAGWRRGLGSPASGHQWELSQSIPLLSLLRNTLGAPMEVL